MEDYRDLLSSLQICSRVSYREALKKLAETGMKAKTTIIVPDIRTKKEQILYFKNAEDLY